MLTAKGLSSSTRCGCMLAVAAMMALLGAAQAQAATGRVLVFHPDPAGHPEVSAGIKAINDLGRSGDFQVDATRNASDFTGANLARYRAVVFLNTFGNRLNGEQEGALADYMQNGGGFVGIGTAAEAEPGTALLDDLIGARPDPASPTGQATQTVAVGDRVHPATRDLPLELNRTDVWYRWQTRPTGTVHTVARWHRLGDPAGDGTTVGGTDHPISWCRDVRGGRSFYTGMGRTTDSYSEQRFRGHLLGAIEWAAGLVRGNCKATINANYRGTRVVGGGPVDTGLATSGESHGLVIAPNGWVIYIGRGDCRTDAERGSLVGFPSLPRILDHADTNVGLGCGSVHVWDPGAYDGTVNSGVTRAGVLAVYGDGGQGGERTNTADHKLEWGLLGVTVAPDFLQTGHIYLQYFPSFNPSSSPPGLPVERRISKMERPRISRFTLNLQTKKLDLSSEVRIFEYDSQIFSCCHVGGGMGFDSQDNLYVTTGDTNSSQGTGGYSGNNQPPTCPTGPPDEPSSAHCGSNAISYQDARRTAGNTNDYNGKMLRFKPIPSIPDGVQPPVGIGTTYTIPGANAPNGPNLFSGTEGNGNQAKPEIYAMGLRNPSRLSIDPKTDVPYTAWVGPDAGRPSDTLGPSTYESAAQVDRAGNYGWPFCMGNQQAYRDRITDGTPRTANAPGYVPGGPASGGTDGWYDCDNLVNDSIRNTGLTVLPHTTGTGMDAGKMRPANLWYSRGNPDDDGNPATNTNNGCPDFPHERGVDGAPNYGAVPRQLCPYALAQGATIMDGPVYRFDKDAADNARRWPEYWDGRWFLHNHGGASIKHGLLLDPDTDQDGGQPVYADSLRNTLSWQGNYMDSKFGPDGALYVQVYDGFFRANPNVGLYRFDYIGGPDTPGPDPQSRPAGGRKVAFSIGRSGGVSFRWDFGDGRGSTAASTTHTYGSAGTFDVTLTVTYADGDVASKTIEVVVP
jgi:glucose/arabinose dehydrogenase/type 1 glutamine amidotransferase